MKKDVLEKELAEGKSLKAIANKYNKGETTVRYWVKKHGLEPNNSTGRTWTDADMREALAISTSIADALREVGLTTRAGNYSTVKRFIKSNNIDISHMLGKKSGKGGVKARPLDEILVENSRAIRKDVKRRLLKEGLLRNECEECGLGAVWNGKEIKMVLDHINGVNDDNRIDNLQMLCPNCNSQQATFCRGQLSFIKSRHPDEFAKQEESKINKCNCGKAIEYRSSQCNKCASVENGK